MLPTAVYLCRLAHRLSCLSHTLTIEVSSSIQSALTPMRPLSGFSQWVLKSSEVVCTCTVALVYLTTIICHFLPCVHFVCVWLAVLAEIFWFFPQSVETNASTVPQIMPLWSPSASFPVYYQLITLPFDAVFSELQTSF